MQSENQGRPGWVQFAQRVGSIIPAHIHNAWSVLLAAWILTALRYQSLSRFVVSQTAPSTWMWMPQRLSTLLPSLIALMSMRCSRFSKSFFFSPLCSASHDTYTLGSGHEIESKNTEIDTHPLYLQRFTPTSQQTPGNSEASPWQKAEKMP